MTLVLALAAVLGVVGVQVFNARNSGVAGAPGTPGNPAATGASLAAQPGWRVAEASVGTLTVSEIFPGQVRGAEVILIESEVNYGYEPGVYSINERKYPRIIWIIEEGTFVNKGDLLAEISSEVVEEQIKEWETIVTNAELNLTQAQEELAMAEMQAKIDIMLAEHTRSQANLLLQQYTEGEFPQQVSKQEMQVKLAEAEYQRALDVYDWSKKLNASGYVTQTELESDRLKLDRSKVDVERAKAALELLKTYDYRRRLAQLQSSARRQDFLVAKATFSANSRVRSATARVRSAEIVLGRQREQLAEMHHQLEATRIYAPSDGRVLYASTNNPGWSGDPIGVGTSVRRGSDIFKLYSGSKLAADLRVSDSKIKRIQVGQTVYVRADAGAEQVVGGRVTKVAVMPESDYQNPFQKWYLVEVLLAPNHLRIGSNCAAEVVLGEIAGATLVPVEAVQWEQATPREPGKPTVLVKSGGVVASRPVELGADDKRFVQVVAGLTPGEQILIPPGQDGPAAMPGITPSLSAAVVSGAE